MTTSIGPRTGAVRRAGLVDVPAVARLLSVSQPGATPGPGSLADGMLTSVMRLALAHVGLEQGEFWVATGDAGQVHAAVVLLPPLLQADPAGLHAALRHELDLMPDSLPRLGTCDGVPGLHWLMLCAATADGEHVVADLLDRALPVVDAGGLAVLSVPSTSASSSLALVAAGFAPVPTGPDGTPALLRPAARRPVGV